MSDFMNLSEIIKIIIPKPNSEDPRAPYKELNKVLEKERSQSKKRGKSRRK